MIFRYSDKMKFLTFHCWHTKDVWNCHPILLSLPLKAQRKHILQVNIQMERCLIYQLTNKAKGWVFCKYFTISALHWLVGTARSQESHFHPVSPSTNGWVHSSNTFMPADHRAKRWGIGRVLPLLSWADSCEQCWILLLPTGSGKQAAHHSDDSSLLCSQLYVFLPVIRKIKLVQVWEWQTHDGHLYR